MSTVQIAKEVRERIEKEKWEVDWQNPDEMMVRRFYVGSYFNLDPCGRYHHILSPNGVTQRCEDFWNSLDKQCTRRGLSLEGGEGDPTDIFICEYRDLDPVLKVKDLAARLNEFPNRSSVPLSDEHWWVTKAAYQALLDAIEELEVTA